MKPLTIEADRVLQGIPEGHVFIVSLLQSLIPPDEWYFNHHLKMLMKYYRNLGMDVNEVCKKIKEHKGALTDSMSCFLLLSKLSGTNLPKKGKDKVRTRNRKPSKNGYKSKGKKKKKLSTLDMASVPALPNTLEVPVLPNKALELPHKPHQNETRPPLVNLDLPSAVATAPAPPDAPALLLAPSGAPAPAPAPASTPGTFSEILTKKGNIQNQVDNLFPGQSKVDSIDDLHIVIANILNSLPNDHLSRSIFITLYHVPQYVSLTFFYIARYFITYTIKR